MKNLTLATFILVLVSCSQESTEKATAINYPESATVEHTDNYHGTEVADAYRWLENDVREDSNVSDWVSAQNEVTFAYLATIPEREPIEKRMTELWDYERFGLPRKRGGRYYYSYNDGLQNQEVIYTQTSLSADPELLVDPNTWSEDGTIALADYEPSPDGRHVAYLVQDGGSDWREARVLDIETGELLGDHLEWLKFTNLSWAADGSGFYYSRYPATSDEEKFQSLNTNMTIYFHALGTSQDKDVVIYETPDHPEWGPRAEVTDDGEHLVITISVGTDDRYSIVHQDLTDPKSEPKILIEGFDYDYALIGNIGDDLYFRTNNAAPKNRIIVIDPTRPEPENWREIIGEADDVLDGISLVGGKLIAEYMQDAWSVVKIFDLDGEEVGMVDLPGIGTASGFNGSVDDLETFFSYSSFNTPATISRLDVSTGEVEIFKKPDVAFDPDDYIVEQVFYTSKDGTRVPMFISHLKSVVPDGNRPTMLYAYGGFNISMQPSFSVTRLTWMEMGGVYAVANLRGGGEYGEEWHKAGTKLQKQNVFDDFIAAGEYLIREGYTNSKKLSIFGGSNGGLLVGAVTNQRPELFGAALPAVGVMDMLRFHKFTAGRFWTDDYGSADNPEEFEALRAYSPYHNIKKGTQYPAILVTTADTDDRVVPGHSFKYAAAIQEAQGGDAPVLIRVETRAGHGAGVPTEKVIESYADQWAFLVRNLDMRLPEGYGE
ncbi:MAG: prolyl oligopeptidase family serine peptidase [Proteobacteria bacterium]|nr:prolyl oligopeptidase family serine peptidase [Pseudomonadota bacterium]MDA0994657.1 prolyl oligopeptidase family serine peptidase [Pseudomonadota bacterium]